MSRPLLWTLLPLALLIAIGAAFLLADPLRTFRMSAPPVEELTVERAVLDGDGIALRVRAGGSEPIRIAQVQVDGAYWQFTQDPPGELSYLSSAWLRLPYPWVVGEAHHVVVLTSLGTAFEYPIDVALASPGRNSLGALGLVGLFVGIVPVALGMLFYPALRAGGRGVYTFALALTVGLLLFLLVDTFEEALELAAEAAPGFHGGVLVWMIAALAALLLLSAGRRRGGNPQGMALATAIALGIGLHSLGAAALGSFLVLGFTLHNVTEGVGIVAPLIEERPRLPVFIALAALAGLPAVLGIWLGSYAFAPHWAALALAVGAGAIFQVIVEVGLLLVRRARSDGRGVMGATAAGGVAAGVALMYATALLVQA
jgi:ZIP family zinc transporter